MGNYNVQENLTPNTRHSNINSRNYHLVLFTDADEMYDLWLPQLLEGFYRFSDYAEHRFLSIYVRDGHWVASCRKPAFFQDVPLEDSYEIPLRDGQLLRVDFEDRTYSVYVEEVSKEQMVFHHYSVPSDTEIIIGSHPSSTICYNSPYISRKHAILRRISSQWNIQDCGSIHGVFVNGERKTTASLNHGDVIYIMGLRIIVGPGHLAINDSNNKVKINRNLLQTMPANHSGYSRYYEQESIDTNEVYYNRSPRKRLEIEKQTIFVEGPPMSMQQKQIPLMLRMGSSVVMGGAAALAGNFMTLISSVMFPFLSSKYTETQRQEYERLRLSKYTEYLVNKRIEIEDACQNEQRLLNQKYPPIQKIVNIVNNKKHLWERRPFDSDFLKVRLGTGTQTLTAKIEYPSRRFELEPDTLEEEMYRLVERPHYVEKAPVVISITDTRVCGLLGERKLVIAYIRQLILQLAAFHSYDEVKFFFILHKEELACLDEIRYLPHTWDNQRTTRFIATDEAEAYRLGEYIKNQISEDRDAEEDFQKIMKKRPYYLIFALDKTLFENHEILKEILQSSDKQGISVITAYNDLPKESQKIISLESAQRNTCTTMAADGGEDALFSVDTCDPEEIASAMHILANTRLKTEAKTQELPKMVTFLEMFRAGKIEQLNSMKRWQENNPIKSLATPVGISTEGEHFVLDLHEKRHGPHGLVAGMTGSGKSEFLITYILSMAVNYHPDEVAFVLIDYKGGGLAGAFENPQTGVRLPHLVGTITNLDGASIQRSLMSIESELIRRQKVFNKAKSASNEGTMDIYSYQKLYRAGKVAEPMPHLFIISDEFAELKQQQPEFMAKLISAARIGRSLGVHLILATQKPSGVVDDQIRSNTKFRVCLRVQERSDSMDMLKRPEAAELIDTGRFYLQVGYNEYFALGQSAWCGAKYTPQDSVTVQRDDAIEFLDTSGQVIAKVNPPVRKTDSGMKQLVAVVQYLSNLATSHEIKTRQLWCPELPALLDLDILNQDNSDRLQSKMSVCLGLLDDPENQEQPPLIVDFRTCQNMLISGTSGSGKTVLVQNIMYSLAKQLPPQEFNFYILDYSSRMLKLFKLLPHCGAVLQEEDIGSLDEFFKLINSIVAERKKLFSKLEIDNFTTARQRKKLPLILVAIDNIAGLAASKLGESHIYQLQHYMKNSDSYGIKYIVTCNHLNEVSSRIRQELPERICLSQRDRYAYSEILGCKVSYIPPEYIGRGLVKWQERPLEFQGASICAIANNIERTAHIKETVKMLCRQYGTEAEAQRLSIIRDDVEYEEFVAQFRRGRIPLGYSRSSGKSVALPLRQMSLLGLYFGNKRSTIPILKNILYSAQREKMELWIIQRNKNTVFDKNSNEDKYVGPLNNADYLPCSVENLRLLQQALVGVATQRKNILDEYYNTAGINPREENTEALDMTVLQEKVPSILLLIENMADFCTSLNELSMLSYSQLFKDLHYYNIYVIACFEPEISKNTNSNMLSSLFSRHDMILFGGNYNQQSLIPISSGAQIDTIPFNQALMVYRHQIHELIMPCGIVKEVIIDEDVQSIF